MPMFLPRYVSVWAWQLGQRILRFSRRLSSRRPLTWSSSSGVGLPFQETPPHISQRRSLSPSAMRRWFSRADGFVGAPAPCRAKHVRCVETQLQDPRRQSTLVPTGTDVELAHDGGNRARPSDRISDLLVRTRSQGSTAKRPSGEPQAEFVHMASHRLVVPSSGHEAELPEHFCHGRRRRNGESKLFLRVSALSDPHGHESVSLKTDTLRPHAGELVGAPASGEALAQLTAR